MTSFIVECKKCSKNTLKRVVLERKPYIDITSELPEQYRAEGWHEFVCLNVINIRIFKKFGDTKIKEICDTNLLCKIPENTEIVFRNKEFKLKEN